MFDDQQLQLMYIKWLQRLTDIRKSIVLIYLQNVNIIEMEDTGNYMVFQENIRGLIHRDHTTTY